MGYHVPRDILIRLGETDDNFEFKPVVQTASMCTKFSPWLRLPESSELRYRRVHRALHLEEIFIFEQSGTRQTHSTQMLTVNFLFFSLPGLFCYSEVLL